MRLTTKILLIDTNQLHHTIHSSLSNNTKNIQLWYQNMFSSMNRYVLIKTLLAITKTYQMSSIVQLLKKQGSIETSNIIQLHTLKAFCRNNSHETRTRRLSALWHAVAGSWSRRQTWNSVLAPEMALKLARLTQKPSTPSLRQWESTRWMAIGYCSAITLAAWSDAGRAQSSRTSAWIVCQAFAFY